MALEGTKFLVDRNLGSLARWLRLLGFDTMYPDILDDGELVKMAKREGRTLLTRDRNLASRNPATVYLVNAENLEGQLQEVVQVFHLSEKANPLSRCSLCNGSVAPVEKDKVRDVVPQKVLDFQQDYWQCSECGKVYWQGSHWGRMKEKLQKVLGFTKEIP